MVVVSNYEKYDDKDQGYDESDCVDLCWCCLVSRNILQKNGESILLISNFASVVTVRFSNNF